MTKRRKKTADKTVFADVSKDEYYYEPVMWAVDMGITSGTGENTFSPESSCTRAQAVTFLWKMVASPEPAAIDMPFDDVWEGTFYYKSVKIVAVKDRKVLSFINVINADGHLKIQ